MKHLLLLLLLPLAAFSQTRNVLLSWTASTTTPCSSTVTTGCVSGYNVYRSTSSTGPFTTPLNSTLLTSTTFTDTGAVIGSTYTYAVTAVGPACTPTTPVGTPCGSSLPATDTTNIPPQPAITVSITVTIP